MPALLALAIEWTLAALVFFPRPHQVQNRRLAVLLFVEGARLGAGLGILYLVTKPDVAYGVQAISSVSGTILPLLYLRFLATIDTPLVGFLRHRATDVVIAALAAGAVVVMVVDPQFFIIRMRPVSYAPWDCECGPYTEPLWTIGGVISLFGLVAAFHAWRISQQGTTNRARSASFALAFGTRDALLSPLFIVFPIFYGFDQFGRTYAWDLVWILGNALVSLLFSLLIAYGILRTQLFDIDLRIKIALRQGTLVAIFLVVFFVVGEGSQSIIANETGSTAVAIAITAGLLFALAPLQRLAERLSDAAMPAVKNTPEYLQYRKFEVYRAAFEGVAGDREVTSRERTILERLRAELRITPADARSIEDEALLRARASATNN